MDNSCPHLSSALNVNKENLLLRSERVCNVCRKREKLWACLQGGCQFVGCGESLHDHSTKHYQKQKHAIAVNLTSFRIWCFACEIEVHLPSSFNAAEMKSLKKARKATHSINTAEETASKMSQEPQQTPEPEPALSPTGYQRSRSPPMGLTGLRNMGNTCYMNSALQAISNCPQLTHYFLNEDAIPIQKKASMARNYLHLMHDMWSPTNHPCIAPSGIHNTLKAINPSFRGYHQQDAQEFLRCFMDRLHEELKYIIPKWTYAEELSANHQESIHTEEEPMEIDEPSENTAPPPSAAQTEFAQNSSSSSDSFTIESESQPMIQQSGVPTVSAATPLARPIAPSDHLHGIDGSKRQQYSVNEETGRRSKTTRTKMKYPNKQIRPTKKSTYRYRSIISEIFDGELRSSVQCLTCDQVSHTRETFQDLSLPIPGKDDLARLHSTNGYFPSGGAGPLAVLPGFKGPCSENTTSWDGVYNVAWNMWEWLKTWFWGPQVTLNDCLSAFFSADELKGDNMYSCNKCNKLRNGVKYCKLLQLPEVLCVHLKRFRHEYLMSYSSKISIPVSFPITGLDLRQYLAKDSPSKCTSYDLCSVIVHLGNAGGGHYTSYAKNFFDNNWYEFDDQFITQVSESVVANAEAYVLFYQKSSAEAVRAQERITQIHTNDQNAASNRTDLLNFYVSKRWLFKFVSFTEPGPIDNSDFLCKHSGILPTAHDNLDLLTTPISETVWCELHKRFGGGPAVTTLAQCHDCEEEQEALQERRDEEKKRFLRLNRANSDIELSTTSVYINIEWFREWEDFLNRKLPEPPGKVDNWPICYTKEGKHILRKSASHAPIAKKAWDYLISVYGGGPEVTPLIRATSRSPNRNVKRQSSRSPPVVPMEQDEDVVTRKDQKENILNPPPVEDSPPEYQEQTTEGVVT